MDPRFRRRLRPIASIVLVFFSWFCIEPWNYALAAQAASKPKPTASKKSHPKKAKSAAEKFEGSLRATKDLVEDLDRDLAEGRDIALTLETLKGHRQSLEAADAEILSEFSATETKLKNKNLPAEILERHRKALADYRANAKKLKEALHAIDRLEKERKKAKADIDRAGEKIKRTQLKDSIKDLKADLNEKVKGPRHTPLDPNKLPFRSPKPNKRKPRLKKEEFTEFHKPIQLAFNGHLSLLQLAQATPDLPTPQDLAETIEVQFTQEIQDLAASLENNPVKIYNWVRNNIDFVPIYGSIQGAPTCLLTKQCNDIDTASLLISLLRASGIAARYVTGTIHVPISQAMDWGGGFTDVLATAQYFADGGTPLATVTEGGTITRLQMEHTWVEAYIDFIPSRGAVHKQGDTWIPLDASFKFHTISDGIDVTAISGFDAQTLLDSALATATIDPTTESVTNIDFSSVTSQVDAINQSVLDHVTNNNIPGTLDTLVGSRTITPLSFSIFAAQLPYRVIVEGNPYSEIPVSLRHRISFSLLDTLQFPYFTYSATLPELATKRITLSYEGETAADQSLLDGAAQSGDSSLPVYLISVKPNLRIEGSIVSSGQATAMGTAQTVQVSFQGPIGNDIVSFNVLAGDYNAFGLNVSKVTAELLETRAARLSENYFNSVEQELGINFDPPIPDDEIFGESLHQNLLAWWLERDFLTESLAVQQGTMEANAPSLGLSASPLTISNLFGVPFSGSYQSFILDIKRDLTLLGHKEGDQSAKIAYNQAAGMIGSALESEIFNQVHTLNSAPVSTAALLIESNKTGIPIYEITQDNVSQIIPLLQQSAPFKTDIQNVVAAGKTVITSGSDIVLGTYTGTGYIVMEPTTGEAAYLISGGLSGGSAGTDPSVIPVAKVPPKSPAVLFLIAHAVKTAGPGVQITNNGEILFNLAKAGSGAGGGAGGAAAAGAGISAAAMAAIIIITIVVTIFATAENAGEGSYVTFYLDALNRRITLDEDHYDDHIRPHEEEGFSRADVNGCLQSRDPERIEIWLRTRNGSWGMICALAPAQPGKVLFVIIDNELSVATAFIPDRDPSDGSVVVTSWLYILDQVVNHFKVNFFGDISVDPTKPYAIVGNTAIPI